MRKTIIVIMSLMLALSLGASGAWGVIINFPDQTLIQQISGAGALNGWSDTIPATVPPGTFNEFETFNATFDTNSHVLTVFTNWGPGTKTVSLFTTADLFLNPVLNAATHQVDSALAAVRLRSGLGTNPQPVFYNPTIQTSQDLFLPSGVLGFGGFFTTNFNAIGPPSFEIPVQASAGTSTGNANVTWTNVGAPLPGPLFSFALDLDEITGLNPNAFNFLWGTATCGNDVIIPLPPTLLLLGSGLLGLGVMRRRMK